MIDSYFPLRLNGIKYRIAEDAEGPGYDKRFSPLLIQTGQAVQGESGKVKLRPDILSWSITDWSGGEGLLKFNEEEANRYWLSHNVDVLAEPGKLQVAHGHEVSNKEDDVNLVESLMMTKGRSLLHGFNVDGNSVRTWDEANTRWNAAVVNGVGGFGGAAYEDATPTGDFRFVYAKENGVASIWSWDGTTFVEHCSDLPTAGESVAIVGLGDYLYTAGHGTTAQVTETSKTDTPLVTSTTILDVSKQGSDGGITGGVGTLTAGDNRLYYMQTNVDETVVWKITPTTANGTGFAEEILRLKGLAATSIWHHMGVVFVGGRIGFDGDNRRMVIMYIRGGEVGVLANLREGVATSGKLIAGPESQAFDKAYFMAKYGPGDDTVEWTLFTVDLITGAVSGSTVFDTADDVSIQSIISHNGSVFIAKGSGVGQKNVLRTTPTVAVNNNQPLTSYLVTSINDFDLKEEKLLLSVRVECEPMSSAHSYKLEYQANQDTSWVVIGTDSTDSSTGTTFVVSTDSLTVKFRNLQLRITLDNGGQTALPSQKLAILGVEVFATVVEGVLEWPMTLELYDDTSEAGGESSTGAVKISNIVTAGATGDVMEFDDGYGDQESGVFNAHDVVLVTYDLALTGPGEGIARVLLREVV